MSKFINCWLTTKFDHQILHLVRLLCVILSKRDKTACVCCDFRYVNTGTVNDSYQMPQADYMYLLRKTLQIAVCICLDNTNGYW